MSDDLYDALSPVLAAAGLELVDLSVTHSHIQVTVDRPGGVDLDALADANREVSAVLDRLDPMPGRYTLEVSSPGLERRLRLPGHFARALGETVSVRLLPGEHAPEGIRRVTGELVAADQDGFVLEGSEVPGGSVRVAYGDVDRARTVFEWGSTPRPGRAGGPARGAKRPAPAAGSDVAGAPAVSGERVTS